MLKCESIFIINYLLPIWPTTFMEIIHTLTNSIENRKNYASYFIKNQCTNAYVPFCIIIHFWETTISYSYVAMCVVQKRYYCSFWIVTYDFFSLLFQRWGCAVSTFTIAISLLFKSFLFTFCNTTNANGNNLLIVPPPSKGVWSTFWSKVKLKNVAFEYQMFKFKFSYLLIVILSNCM